MDGNAFATFVAGSRWQFAKTMANIPHAYTRRVWCDDKAFEDAVIFIRANGYQGEFYSRAYLYYDLGSYQYWTMGDPVGETILINRALKPGEEECGPLASPGTSLQLKAKLEAPGGSQAVAGWLSRNWTELEAVHRVLSSEGRLVSSWLDLGEGEASSLEQLKAKLEAEGVKFNEDGSAAASSHFG